MNQSTPTGQPAGYSGARQRALVIGATGVLGSRLVSRLQSSGASVRVLSRPGGRPPTAGVEPVMGSLHDRASLDNAVKGADLVFHLASRIPAGLAMRSARGWRANDQVRDQGTANLVAALLQHPARTVVMAGIAGSVRNVDAHWRQALEDSHILARSSLLAESHLERLDGTMGWTCLRFGRFVGESVDSGKQTLDAARRGINPFIGKSDDPVSLIHIDDAVDALMAAAVAQPQGSFAVPGCIPKARADLALRLGGALTGKPLRSLPVWLARMMLGVAYEPLCQPLRIDGTNFCAATGWQARIRDPLQALLAV